MVLQEEKWDKIIFINAFGQKVFICRFSRLLNTEPFTGHIERDVIMKINVETKKMN